MVRTSTPGILEQLRERVDALDHRIAHFEVRVAARLEQMQIRQAGQTDYVDATLPADLPPQYVAGRWKPRDGNVYGRYTYEESTDKGQLDPYFRRSPPATD